MKLHPIIFALMTYGIAMTIALCVAFIVKLIAVFAQRGEKNTAAANAKKES